MSSSGESLLLVVLLGLAGGTAPASATAALAMTAVALRWGSTSLDAIAGAQSVLGPAGLVGPVGLAASSWCAAAAMVLASPGGWAGPALGLAAGLVVAGPAAGSAVQIAVRLVGAGGGVVLALVVGSRARRRPRDGRRLEALALGLAGAAVVLAVWP